MGTSLDDVSITLEEIASQTHGQHNMDVGDSYTFKGVIDLPAIKVEDKADVKIEIFVIDPEDGLTGFHICQAHVVTDSRGANVRSIQTHPYYEDTYKTTNPNVVSMRFSS